MRNKKNLSVIGGLFAALIFGPTAAAIPTDFSKVYVFGDSLSDIGNVSTLSGGLVPPADGTTQRYSSGRFSNGPIWVDGLTAALGINTSQFVPSLQASPADYAANYSINFAYGGAGTGLSNRSPDGSLMLRGLLGQVADFAALSGAAGGVTDPTQSLYVVWAGANDYLLAGVPITGIPNPPNPVNIVQNIKTGIQSLYDQGARHFLVPNLPDLGETPIIALSDPGTRAYFDSLTQQHNALLHTVLLELLAADPGITFYSPDVQGLYREIFIDPSAFGFTHALTDLGPASGCLILPPNTCDSLVRSGLTPLDGDGFPTWDEEHPTTATHELIAQRALAANVVPEPATPGLTLLGIAFLISNRRRPNQRRTIST